MAVGARILSNNLSGKTATVTFIPVTGITSGTTQNLGQKTIPFNNITSHPYGYYHINVTEYDYTYVLHIPEPSYDQVFVVVDRMVNSDNYGAAVLNFTDITAEVVDLGVNALYWDNNDLIPLQDVGFMHIFTGDANYNEKLVIFTDVNLTEIGRYSGTTNNWDDQIIMGKWVSFEDSDNGVLKYFNGTTVYEYTWNPSTHYIDIENDYDSSTSDGSFIIKKFEEGQWDYNGNGESYLVNPADGTTSLLKTWLDGTLVTHVMCATSDFISVETRNQSNTGTTYTSMEIYSSSGTLLETISLTGNTYTGRYRNFIGTNKYCVTYYNDNDNSVDYKIIHYNSDTSTLTETSHVRGSNYTSINMVSDTDFYPESSNTNGGVVIMLYTVNGYTNVGEVVDYCDIVYMLPSQTSFTTYQYADGTTSSIGTWGQLTNFFRTYCGRGNNNFEIMTISSTGTTFATTEIPVSGVTNMNFYYLINRSLFNLLVDGYTTLHSILVNQSGQIEQTIINELASAWQYTSDTFGSVGYVGAQTTTGDTGYYIYSGVTGFTQTEYFNNSDRADVFEDKVTNLRPSNLVLHNSNSLSFRVLTPSGITDLLSFPEEWTNKNLRVGKDKFMLVYTSDADGFVNIVLYDLAGQILNSHTTTYTGWNNMWAIKDRFVVQCIDNGVSEYFLVNSTNATSVSLQDYDTENAPNDLLWWWD